MLHQNDIVAEKKTGRQGELIEAPRPEFKTDTLRWRVEFSDGKYPAMNYFINESDLILIHCPHDVDRLHSVLRGLENPGVGASGLGTSKEEHTQTMCETVHAELASLKETAIRDDGSDETKKAKQDILTLALLLDGDDSILEYLVQICKNARENPTD
jgi:hypothetical protein